MRRSGFLAHAVVCSALAVALAGCGAGNPKPAPPASESVSQSAAPTASASPVAPTLPAEATGTSAAAAKAFVRHYLAVFSYAARTGDTDALQTLGTPACMSCNSVVAQIQKLYRAGGHAEGRGYVASHMKVTTTSAKKISIRARVILFPQVVYVSPDAESQKSGSVTTPTEYILTRVTAGWIISGWERIP